MDIARLIQKLKPLLDDVEGNLDKLLELLVQTDQLAELEIARAFVAPKLKPLVNDLLESQNPKDRVRAVRIARSMYGRAAAGSVLRRAACDRNTAVRYAARMGARRLALTDVALPLVNDKSAKKNRGPGTSWSYWGWFYGRLPFASGPSKKKKSATEQVFPKTLDAFLKELGLTEADLKKLTRAGTAAGSPYVTFEIPKATGGTRTIAAPRASLRKAQRTILHRYLDKLKVHDAAHGFVTGRSTVSNALPHVGAKLLIRVDIKDFFPTVHYRRVVGLMKHHGATEEVAQAIARLATYRPVLEDGKVAWPSVLPQGAPTSPTLANLACRKLDARLSKLAEKVGAVYTRYADDLSFSFKKLPENGVGRVLWWINSILQQEGFVENVKKRRVMRTCNQQRVTGVVVNERPGLPRDERRRFKAILANCRKHGWKTQTRGREDFASYLLGYASYAKMVQPDLGERWLKEVREILAG
ncbi:MAG: reverse transcriptase family protein [Polyangiaceae bacterium]